MNRQRNNISRYLFLALFLGFFGCNTFFDHTHIYDGNIIVHSHPFRHDRDGKPLHSHGDSAYLLIHLLNNYIANVFSGISFLALVLILYGEVIIQKVQGIPSGTFRSVILLRGPPAVSLA